MTGLPGGNIDEVLKSCAQSLEENPDGATWQVLSYDGFVDLDRGRSDAVIVILQTYGNAPLKIKIAFPYRPAQGGRSFSILDPTLRSANVDNDKVSKLGSAMQRGIESIKWAFGKTWDQLRE